MHDNIFTRTINQEPSSPDCNLQVTNKIKETRNGYIPTMTSTSTITISTTSLSTMASQLESATATIASLTSTLALVERRLQAQEDITAIRALLDHYTALHDRAFHDSDALQQWEDLFTSDAHVKYEFGEHSGRAGLAAWAWGPSVADYDQCHLQSSNFDISFDDRDRDLARVRSNLITHWLYKREEPDKHFDAGGVYQWTMRRETEEGKGWMGWAIAKIDLNCVWTRGEDTAGVTRLAT